MFMPVKPHRTAMRLTGKNCHKSQAVSNAWGLIVFPLRQCLKDERQVTRLTLRMNAVGSSGGSAFVVFADEMFIHPL